jgi:hypothetical protein
MKPDDNDDVMITSEIEWDACLEEYEQSMGDLLKGIPLPPSSRSSAVTGPYNPSHAEAMSAMRAFLNANSDILEEMKICIKEWNRLSAKDICGYMDLLHRQIAEYKRASIKERV